MSEDYTAQEAKDTEGIREAIRESADMPITNLDLMKNDAYAHMRRKGEQVYTGSESEASGEFREVSGRFDGANDYDGENYPDSENDGEFVEDEGDEDNTGDMDDETFAEAGEDDDVELDINDKLDDSEIDDSSFDCD